MCIDSHAVMCQVSQKLFLSTDLSLFLCMHLNLDLQSEGHSTEHYDHGLAEKIFYFFY